VSQVDPNTVRQRVQQARDHLAKGDSAKAKSVLKGLDHPKAQALLAQIEVESPTPKRARLPMLPIIGLLAVMILACGGGFFLLNNRPTPTPAPLPTLIPTDACTPAEVDAWWQSQQMTTFSRFAELASAGSRTMPGERLASILDELIGLRNFSPPPSCLTSAQRERLAMLDDLMRQAVETLTDWDHGIIDGTAMSNLMAEWEAEWRRMRAGWGR